MIEGIAILHIATACAALLLGAIVLFRPKGTTTHKRLGYGYAASMMVLNITALCLYRLTGRFNVLHIFAIISLVTLLAGIGVAVLRRPRADWLRKHGELMCWSYTGLLSAGMAELAIRVFAPPFWITIGTIAAFVFLAAWLCIPRLTANHDAMQP